MAETYKVKHPNGFTVEVKSAARRDVLLARGYTEEAKKTTAKKASK